MADLDGAITLGQSVLEPRPPGHSGRIETLFDLGYYLNNKFYEDGTEADLDEAILLHRSALDLRPEGHGDRSDSLHHLALCLGDRYDEGGPIADLEEAITLGRAAHLLALRWTTTAAAPQPQLFPTTTTTF